VGENFDSCSLDSDNPCGRGGVTGAGDKIGVVGWADQTEHEDTDDIEQEDTDPNTTNSARDGLGRVVGFCGSDSDNLGSQEGVGSVDQDRPDTSETA